ncbi:RNA-binding protein [Bowdeniella nasicola]|uniref:RNA-binding protein n=1 Tax=Bowdeniella nasicola TaxID=208480 RepID=A0A1Q5Q0T0_9ACTO|nr:RNA-binding S4 domain-containing protein [Bowdeniella nasicola]OKL53464.1 RNA-binding protein [Bowdeniella nasicola]
MTTPTITGSVRVDVWLWSVRQIKTRSAAGQACRAGHVRVNGERAKPATPVRIGDEVRYRFQGFDRILEVTALLKKRVGASVAAECYIDHSPPRPTPLVAPIPVFRDPGAGRPTKKERRALDRLMGRDSSARR